MANQTSAQCQALLLDQRGIVARWQLGDCTADVMAAERLVRNGRWQPLYRGVYASYTGRPARAGFLWAAVLRCGPGAVLSYHSAAELDRLTDTSSGAIHVTIGDQDRVRLGPRDRRTGSPRIVLHRSVRIGAATHPARMPPRTRIEETVLDLVDTAATFDAAFGWLTTACGRRLVTPWQLRVAAGQRARLRWRTDLSGALEEITDGVTSPLEHRFVVNVERPHRLPPPRRQARQRRGETSAYLDNFYEDQLLAVELDGLSAHPVESRWRDDGRDNYFITKGIVTMRYNWAAVTQRSCQVAAEIAAALQERGWTGQLRRCPLCPPRLAS